MKMKHFLLLPALLLAFVPLFAQQVDPYHTATGGFGHAIASSSDATLWWAEGTYKIMQDMPAPGGKAGAVSVCSARNEWESFQVVVRPERELRQVAVSVSDFQAKKGSLPASAFTIRKVRGGEAPHGRVREGGPVA